MADVGYRYCEDTAAAVGKFDREGEPGVEALLVV
jgi:hypothetical protein